jgi:hypothetical protein
MNAISIAIEIAFTRCASGASNIYIRYIVTYQDLRLPSRLPSRLHSRLHWRLATWAFQQTGTLPSRMPSTGRLFGRRMQCCCTLNVAHREQPALGSVT